MGHRVAISSAYVFAEYPLPKLEFDSEKTRSLMSNMFKTIDDFADARELETAFNKSMELLEQGFSQVIEDFPR